MSLTAVAGGSTADKIARTDKRGPGWDFVHSAIDDRSRLAYSEILPDEKADTCAEFWERARQFFADYGIDGRPVS